MIDNKLKASLIETYDKYAHTRDDKPIDWWKAEEGAYFLAQLQAEGKETLLEIGAGTGRESLFFKENGLQPFAIDLSPVMIEICQQKGLEAAVMSFDNLSFLDASFDAVWSLNCLLHAPKAVFPSILEGIHRVLKPNGLFYLAMYGGYDFEGIWNNDDYSPKRFYNFYTNQAIQEIVSQVFELEYFKPIVIDEEKKAVEQSMILRKR